VSLRARRKIEFLTKKLKSKVRYSTVPDLPGKPNKYTKKLNKKVFVLTQPSILYIEINYDIQYVKEVVAYLKDLRIERLMAHETGEFFFRILLTP
jgi:hypothetical protein